MIRTVGLGSGILLALGCFGVVHAADVLEVSSAVVSSSGGGEWVVDDFERPVPQRVYQVYQGDESTLFIASSREAAKGTYSMQLEYRFSTTQPWGSWVIARHVLPTPLDWTGAHSLELMVKGDGSDNVLRFTLLQENGDTWQFIDANVLSDTRWSRVVIPISDFKIFGEKETTQTLDFSRITSFEIGVLSRRSSQSAGAKTGDGRVYVDELVIKGPLRDPVRAVPASEALGLSVPIGGATEVARVNFAVSGLAEFSNTPEQKSRVIHFASLVADAGVEKFGARVDFTSEGQEFGESAAYVGSTVTVTEVDNPGVEMRSVEFIANNLHPLLRHVVVGNIFADYSLYTFSPISGFKGLSGEGDFKRFNYQAFVLKHMYDSFTAGTRMRLTGKWWYLEGIAVDWQGQALMEGGSEVNSDGQLKPSPPEEIDARTYARDWVATAEARGRFFDERLTLATIYGQNHYRVYADIDYSDPFKPIYNQELDQSLKEDGNMFRASARSLGLLWKGLGLDYEFRRVDTEFKPRYRQDPFGFDNQESDQEGHNFHISQWNAGWVFSGEYDQLRRLSNDDYRQYRTQWGVGRYGIRGLSIGFNQTLTRSRYVFTSNRSNFNTDEDQRLIVNELFVRAQVLSNLVVWFRPSHELKHDYKVDDSFTQDSLHGRLEYYANTNVKTFLEFKTTRFSRPEFEPTGFPFDDNFLKLTLEVTF